MTLIAFKTLLIQSYGKLKIHNITTKTIKASREVQLLRLVIDNSFTVHCNPKYQAQVDELMPKLIHTKRWTLYLKGGVFSFFKTSLSV